MALTDELALHCHRHNGPNFMTFHRAWLLELEQALLSVVPGLKAIPYLDFTLDLKGGAYYGTANSIFSQKYAGGNNCSSGPAKLCQVCEKHVKIKGGEKLCR